MPLFGRRHAQPVTCHFCGQTTSSPIQHKTGWICPDSACSQYNGFTADGDYNLNVVNEFSPNTALPPRHCKPTPLPFPPAANGFHSDSHFHRDSYIAASSSVPLCPRCLHNQGVIQQKLREFDPGANSNYNACIEYRRLLERSYPLCAHCSTQSQYRLNTVNHKFCLIPSFSLSLPQCTVYTESIHESPIKKWLENAHSLNFATFECMTL